MTISQPAKEAEAEMSACLCESCKVKNLQIIQTACETYAAEKVKGLEEKLARVHRLIELLEQKKVTPNSHWVSRGTFNQVAAERDELAKQLADVRSERDELVQFKARIEDAAKKGLADEPRIEVSMEGQAWANSIARHLAWGKDAAVRLYLATTELSTLRVQVAELEATIKNTQPSADSTLDTQPG